MTLPAPRLEQERQAALERYKVLDTPPEEAFDRITRVTAAALGVPIALVSLVDRDRQWFKSRQGLDAGETSRDVAFCDIAIGSDDVLVVPDAAADPRFAGNPLVVGDPKIRFYAGAPLCTADGHRLGTLCVIDRKPRTLGGPDRQVLVDLAAMVMTELEIRLVGLQAVTELCAAEGAVQELQRLAHTDPLTGVLNRRGFLATAERELVRAQRYARPLSVLLLDVDHFKRVNDAFGHAMGDAVLRYVVAQTRRGLRATDVLGRLGGEEFAILAPETPLDSALMLGQRLRDGLASASMATQGTSVRVTASIGVADRAKGPATIDDVLRRADAALYAAKRGGRNRVERHDGPPMTLGVDAPDQGLAAGDAVAARPD